MAVMRYNVRTCTLMVGCDGASTTAKDGVCQSCKDRMVRMERNKIEYEKAQRLLAQAARNGRRETSEAK